MHTAPLVADPPVYGYEIVATYPHDPNSFTQGFAYDNGLVYEGTGIYGHSRLMRYFLDGTHFQSGTLPNHLFGEGITVYGDLVIQLTWKAGLGIVWDKNTLQVQRLFRYPSEGWGLTHDGRWLIISNGSNRLAFIDPITFSFHHHLLVSDSNGPVQQLNELEYVKGEIWANIWRDDRIVRINPENGKVTGWIDFAGLVEMAAPAGQDNVLNGIAYDKKNSRIFVTGKRWSQLFEIRVTKKENIHPPVPLLK